MHHKRFSIILLLVFVLMAGSAGPSPTQAAVQGGDGITARMLTAPRALMGPGPSSFNWNPVGATLAYVEPKDGQDLLWLYDAATARKRVLLDPSTSPDTTIDLTSAQWSPRDNRLLLAGAESLWLLDAKTGELKPLVKTKEAKTGLAFSPDGAQVAYVQNNDLYTVRVKTRQIQRLTTDGNKSIFNGVLDWVYNEELATRAAQPAFAWSPDSRWLIYLRLDDSAVQEDPITDYRSVPPTVNYTRYPTAGTTNSVASLHVISAHGSRHARDVRLPDTDEYILPLFTWTPDGREAIYMTVNRDHTVLELRGWNAATGATRTIIRETDPDWINEDRYAPPVFLGDGGQFLWLSERDGFMHLYLYTWRGALVRQLTQGGWMIDSTAWNLLTPSQPVHVDPSGTWAYFITTKNSPLERQIYRVNIANGQLQQISEAPGFHFQALSGDGKYLVDQFSDIATPPVTSIVVSDGSTAQVLATCAGPSLDLPEVTREFVTVKAHDGVDLYAQIVKPVGFDPAKKYPVVVHWYGGPGLQMVSNRYGATNIFNIIERDVLYTQEGFIVWRLDNRGMFGRGHAFETPVFGELGRTALDDQLAGIEYLRTLPYVDAARIGTDGKSFGGYLTLYALIFAPDVFRCGVAGAAPTNWSYYDTIYTERYMRTPQANPKGYAATNLVEKVSQIQARPLLIHGLADTNVHLQNTVNFIQALQANDKLFDFIPLPNLSHSFQGDGLVAALSASENYFARCLGAP